MTDPLINPDGDDPDGVVTGVTGVVVDKIVVGPGEGLPPLIPVDPEDPPDPALEEEDDDQADA